MRRAVRQAATAVLPGAQPGRDIEALPNAAQRGRLSMRCWNIDLGDDQGQHDDREQRPDHTKYPHGILPVDPYEPLTAHVSVGAL
jgi:hypothetical protein